ncbi:uncharacterized protein LOC135956535 [Calliphora vicina]|uniref:uncharacterized protein LOC135956535 n=1 Tax=Calliphora vicina TaxID=7373 RepID=UPI00325B3606
MFGVGHVRSSFIPHYQVIQLHAYNINPKFYSIKCYIYVYKQSCKSPKLKDCNTILANRTRSYAFALNFRDKNGCNPAGRADIGLMTVMTAIIMGFVISRVWQ